MIYDLCFKLNFKLMRNIEKICGIYCISNSKYFYLGQSVDIYRRWNKHRWELKNDKHKNQIMQNVYNLYKEDDPFEYTIGQLLSIHNTVNAAMTSTGITAYEIKKNIEGKTNNAGGFIWKYQN
jgi:hypothetical protein